MFVGGRFTMSVVSEANLPPSTGGTAAPPGAYKMPGAPRNQRFYVTIPRGVRPGQLFAMFIFIYLFIYLFIRTISIHLPPILINSLIYSSKYLSIYPVNILHGYVMFIARDL
jgi:hypothetical protein